jgi:hypothetical protein
MKVVRDVFNSNFTLSTNYVNFEKVGYIVEDTIRTTKIHGKTAIPYGEYLLALRFSPKFSDDYYWSEKYGKLITKSAYSLLKEKEDYQPHLMLWLTNVPNFEFILIHWGNTSDDTEGCLIVGEDRMSIGVINSRINYMKIYPILYKEVKLGNRYVEITK